MDDWTIWHNLLDKHEQYIDHLNGKFTDLIPELVDNMAARIAALEAQVATLTADRARLVEFVQELSTHQPHDNPLYGTLTAILWRFGERAAALLAVVA